MFSISFIPRSVCVCVCVAGRLLLFCSIAKSLSVCVCVCTVCFVANVLFIHTHTRQFTCILYSFFFFLVVFILMRAKWNILHIHTSIVTLIKKKLPFNIPRTHAHTYAFHAKRISIVFHSNYVSRPQMRRLSYVIFGSTK